MKRHAWLNLALIVAVAALALFAYYKPQKSEPQLALSTLKPADATAIKIEFTGTPPVTLARAGADWNITTPLAARADSAQVQRLLGILEATAKDRLPAIGVARYDLNEPLARVTVNQQTFAFGGINEMSREQYVLTQDSIYPVSIRYGALLPKSAYELVSRQIFGADEAPIAFRFNDFSLVQQDGKWQLTPPATDLSADDITRWIDEWRLASALGVLPASNRKPLSVIRVTLKSGGEITLGILQREPQLVLARSDRPFDYQLSGEQAKRLLAPPAAAPAPAAAAPAPASK
jgi:hypothetical protein